MSDQQVLAEESFELENYISWRAFFAGLLFFLFVYAILALFCWLNAEATLQARSGKLDSITVLLERTPAPVDDLKPDDLAEPVEPLATVKSIDFAAIISSFEKYENGMVKAPVPGLFVESNLGKIPAIRDDGLTSFQVYRKPFNASVVAASRAVVSLVVVDIGLSAPATESAIASMPEEVTFLLSPYAADLDLWGEKTRSSGHEIWLGLPLEPRDPLTYDTGPLTLLSDTALEINLQRLNRILGMANGYAGVIATKNTIFYKSELESKEIIKSVFTKGLGYADATTRLQTVPQSVALASENPYVHADIWLDENLDPQAINARLQALREIALDHGYAVGFLHPVPASLKATAEWIKSLGEENISLAPLSVQTWKRLDQHGQ